VDNSERPLLPPPRRLPRSEPEPIIEPPIDALLAVRPPKALQQVEELEPFVSEPLENQQIQLAAERVQQAQATALDADDVRQALNDKRYVAIGTSLIKDRKANTTSLMSVFYNYDDNLAVEVSLDEDAQEVTAVAEERYQPAPTQEEINQAIALARGHDNLASESLVENGDLEGTAILVSPEDPMDPNYNHRQFDVRLVHPNERLPRYWALVDLSTETVLKAGSVRSDNA
jgi:hypothetical protein